MPRLTLDELRKGKVSDATRQLNPGLFGAGAMGRLGAKDYGKSKV